MQEKNLTKRYTVPHKNCLFVSPDMDLVERYAWLKSSDRDSEMGALAVNNRRTLILTPGIYTVLSTLSLVDFVDMVGIGSTKDTKVTKASAGGPTVIQTCNDVHLTGFWIHSLGYVNDDWGFLINIASGTNADSVYRFMHFESDQESTTRGNVFGESDIYGTWEFCSAGDFSWRVDANMSLAATMRFCSAGYRAYGGDVVGTDISGTLIHCVGGEQSFGGCANYGCNISGWLEDCTGGSMSFALGKDFSGTALRCRGGRNCFGGWDGTSAFYGTFSGKAIDCQVDGGNNFGMGHSSCVLAGQVINCRNGEDGDYTAGRLNSGPCTITDNTAAATLTTAFAGDNNDILFTAVKTGLQGNKIQIILTSDYTSMQDVSCNEFVGLDGDTIIITHKNIEAGVTTAQTVVDNINGHVKAPNWITAANAPGNDGTGTVETLAATNLSGGKAGLLFQGNSPIIPTACIDDTTIREFDSGHTYTNEGSTGTVTELLPAAIVGLHYEFYVMTAQEFRLDPNGTDTIANAAGVQQAAGKYLYSNTVGAKCFLYCVKAGQWEHINPTLNDDWSVEV